MMHLLIALTLTYGAPAQTPPKQQGYFYGDARARPQETPQEKARREWQERWPNMYHCRLPACSTR